MASNSVRLTLVAGALVSLSGAIALAQEAAAPAPAAIPSTLPGGANSISEVHGDWTVSCAMGKEAKQCVLNQSLGDSQTGQRVLAVELAVPAANRAEGMLLAPFGLRLADGIKLGVDGKALAAPFPFLTCIASGCLVPLGFDEATLTTLRAGTKLEIGGVSADGAQPVALSISLAGFTAATNRALELSK